MRNLGHALPFSLLFVAAGSSAPKEAEEPRAEVTQEPQPQQQQPVESGTVEATAPLAQGQGDILSQEVERLTLKQQKDRFLV